MNTDSVARIIGQFQPPPTAYNWDWWQREAKLNRAYVVSGNKIEMIERSGSYCHVLLFRFTDEDGNVGYFKIEGYPDSYVSAIDWESLHPVEVKVETVITYL